MSLRDQLDPMVAEAIQLIPFEDMSAETLPSVRLEFELPVSGAVERTDHVVPGDPPVPIRVHRTVGDDRRLPCLFSMHGGGFVMGSYALDDPVFDALCPKLGCVGVSVEYRLAPETPYPGPIEDCYRALAWVVANADELGIDPDKIGVTGLSAGGGLAAALALLARDRGEIQLAFQLLDSPMLDDRQVTPSSQQDGIPVWSRESNTFGWQSYLGDLYGRDDVPHTAAPARATDLSGLPPSFVSVGAVDGFRDEDVDYATRLNQAGVPTELHVYPGACHAYQIAVDSPVAKQAQRDAEDWLARQFAE